ncbi:hypothetical protein AB0425_02575 [Actinosynnema sp. NPDC051121]|nr:hypothetical protein [Saccharothrix sp.]
MIRALLVVAAVAVTTGACTSEADRAFDYAAQDARDAAERDRLRVEGAARKAREKGPEAALAEAVAGDPKRVFGTRTTADGFELDAVYYGQGQAGGGWTAESRSVRLCVRFIGRVEPKPVVEAADVECAASLPSVAPDSGTFNRTIRLTD